jgi:hypothetical protein
MENLSVFLAMDILKFERTSGDANELGNSLISNIPKFLEEYEDVSIQELDFVSKQDFDMYSKDQDNFEYFDEMGDSMIQEILVPAFSLAPFDNYQTHEKFKELFLERLVEIIKLYLEANGKAINRELPQPEKNGFSGRGCKKA